MKVFFPLIPAFLIFPLGVVVLDNPVAKLIWATVGLLFLLKLGSIIRNKQLSLPMPRGIGWFLYGS